MQNRTIPTNTLIPHLIYRDYLAAAWLTRVFHFTEHFRYGDPTSGGMQLHLNDAHIMITNPRPHTDSPINLNTCTQYLTSSSPTSKPTTTKPSASKPSSGKTSTKPPTANANTEPSTVTTTAGSSPNTPATWPPPTGAPPSPPPDPRPNNSVTPKLTLSSK